LSVLRKVTETQQGESDKSEEVSIEVRYGSEGRTVQLDRNSDRFQPPDQTRQFIFADGKDREISFADLIQFWNFDNRSAILQLIDKKLNPEGEGRGEFAEGNVKGIWIRNSDEKAMLLTKGVDTAEFVPCLDTAVENPKHVEAESIATKGWLGAMVRSIRATHIMTFFLGMIN